MPFPEFHPKSLCEAALGTFAQLQDRQRVLVDKLAFEDERRVVGENLRLARPIGTFARNDYVGMLFDCLAKDIERRSIGDGDSSRNNLIASGVKRAARAVLLNVLHDLENRHVLIVLAQHTH